MLMIADIEAEIAEEMAQEHLLERDLKDALLAGENTRPYRHALDEIGKKIAHLRQNLMAAHEAEAERRYALSAATAAEISAESGRRHVELLARLDAPAVPTIEGF
jgi:hypothetical protein